MGQTRGKGVGQGLIDLSSIPGLGILMKQGQLAQAQAQARCGEYLLEAFDASPEARTGAGSQPASLDALGVGSIDTITAWQEQHSGSMSARVPANSRAAVHGDCVAHGRDVVCGVDVGVCAGRDRGFGGRSPCCCCCGRRGWRPPWHCRRWSPSVLAARTPSRPP